MSSRFKDKINASTSGLATESRLRGAAAAAYVKPDDSKARDDSGLTITPKASRVGVPYRRLIGYERTGPWHRQIGITIIGGKELPLMQTYFVHRYMHATKGPRAYTGSANMRLPFAPQNGSPRVRFYGGIRARRLQLIASQAREAARKAKEAA